MYNLDIEITIFYNDNKGVYVNERFRTTNHYKSNYPILIDIDLNIFPIFKEISEIIEHFKNFGIDIYNYSKSKQNSFFLFATDWIEKDIGDALLIQFMSHKNNKIHNSFSYSMKSVIYDIKKNNNLVRINDHYYYNNLYYEYEKWLKLPEVIKNKRLEKLNLLKCIL